MDKVLIIGANGFVGKAVARELSKDFETILASNKQQSGFTTLDATNVNQATDVLNECSPDYIVNCAGIVQNSELAAMNVDITKTLLSAVVATKLSVKRFVLLGSAAEYGQVQAMGAGIDEDYPIRPVSIYGKYKAEEVRQATAIGQNKGINVIVARLFNPIGPGMNDRFLISVLVRQFRELRAGTRSSLEVSRLDSVRDYIGVRDVARAIATLLRTKGLEHTVYNVGSGKETSNGKLIGLLCEALNINSLPDVVESQQYPEKLIASKANIARITALGWQPKLKLKDTIMEVIK